MLSGDEPAPVVRDPNSGMLRPASSTKPLASKSVGAAKKSRLRILVALALILLVLLFSVGGIVTYQNYVNQANAIAIANHYATSTAQTIASNPYPSYLSGNGTLSFVDPLSQKGRWSPSSDSSIRGACQFSGGAYHVSARLSQYFMACLASGTFSNFAFEVQFRNQGDCGGLVFRNDGDGHFYDFHVCTNGKYKLDKYVSRLGSDAITLHSNISSAIHVGLGKTNKIAVVANYNTITLYVNGQQIDQEQDGSYSYSSGSIGLTADPELGDPTEVAYTNARLWTL